MKKTITIYSILTAILLISCSKTSESNKKATNENKEIITEILADNGEIDKNIDYNVNINGKKTIKTDYVYQATDGTLVKVKFNYEPENSTISITNNNKTIMK